MNQLLRVNCSVTPSSLAPVAELVVFSAMPLPPARCTLSRSATGAAVTSTFSSGARDSTTL